MGCSGSKTGKYETVTEPDPPKPKAAPAAAKPPVAKVEVPNSATPPPASPSPPLPGAVEGPVAASNPKSNNVAPKPAGAASEPPIPSSQDVVQQDAAAAVSANGQDETRQVISTGTDPDAEAESIKAAHPDWVKLFESLGPDDDGLLSFASVSEALRRMTSITRTQVNALLVAMDLNGDGMLSLTEYVLMGDAILSGEMSRYAAVAGADLSNFKKIYMDANAVRRKSRDSLLRILEQPDILRDLGEKYDRIQELRERYHRITDAFDAHDPEETGQIDQAGLVKGIRILCPTAAKKQLSILVEADHVNDVNKASFDFEFFFHALQSLVTGNLEHFPQVDKDEFVKARDQIAALRGKVKDNMKQDTVQAAAERYPDWFTAWETKINGKDRMPQTDVVDLVVEIVPEGSVVVIQLNRLIGALPDYDGHCDFIEFCHVLNACLHDDFSAFPDFSSSAFKSLRVCDLKSRKSIGLQLLSSDRLAEIESLKAEQREWWDVFSSSDAEGEGLLSLCDMRTALRRLVETQLSMKQLRVMFTAMDRDKDDLVDFVTFCHCVRAVLHNDLSHFPSLNPEEWQKMWEDSARIRSEARKMLRHTTCESLSRGSSKGPIHALDEILPEKPFDEYIQKYPEWYEFFREADLNGDGALDFAEMAHTLRKIVPNLSAAQLRMLFKQLDQNNNGKLDFVEMCWFGRALSSGDLSDFPAFKEVDPVAFRSCMARVEAIRIKMRANVEQSFDEFQAQESNAANGVKNADVVPADGNPPEDGVPAEEGKSAEEPKPAKEMTAPEDAPAEENKTAEDVGPMAAEKPAEEDAGPAQENAEHGAPVEEVQPAEVSAPVEEVQPAEVSAPVEEVQPVEVSAPAEEVQPVEVSAPAEEVQPAEEIQAAEVSAPAEEVQPAEVSAPVEEVQPVEVSAPAEEVQPAEVSAPAEEVQPAEEIQAAEVSAPVEEVQPAEEVNPAEDAAPAGS